MAMGYIQYRNDLDDKAAVQFMVDDNPEQYPMGTIIQAADGSAWLVASENTVPVTLDAVNATGGADLTYDTVKNADILDIPETWTQIGLLLPPLRPAGVYEVKIAVQYKYSTTAESPHFRFEIDYLGWNTVSPSIIDDGETHTYYYAFPDTYIQDLHRIELQMRKPLVGSPTLDVEFSDVSFQRVG
jgi:hypothetical protein